MTNFVAWPQMLIRSIPDRLASSCGGTTGAVAAANGLSDLVTFTDHRFEYSWKVALIFMLCWKDFRYLGSSITLVAIV